MAVMARARNTGMVFRWDAKALKPVYPSTAGAPPVLVQPVKATISIRKPGARKVTLLDHDGLETGRAMPVQSGSFHIDGT